MRLLLIAYEFPPSPSPQSLRWTYLVRELAALGHEVHVLTVDLGGETPGLPALPDSVRIHRTFPGFLRGALALHREYRMRHPRKPPGPESTRPEGGGDALRPPRNWKQRISEAVQGVAGLLHFPDIRGEWRRHGKRELGRLVMTLQPDVVISSHEPATTLELGLTLRGSRVPWIVDLGDPVLAPYTPSRWRARALRLEQAVFRHAAHVIVTNPNALEQMRNRHGSDMPMTVLTQGFDPAASEQPALAAEPFDPRRLELLYTGSLYAFRRIDALLEALRAEPRIRLSIASVTVPETILAASKAMPEQLRLLGFLPHRHALAIQRRADVLINIANDDPAQIPGKFYEYLGAARPILHLADDPDLVATRITELRRGWSRPNDASAIAGLLVDLVGAKAAGRLDAGISLHPGDVRAHSWPHIASQLDALIQNVLRQWNRNLHE
ncbi:glycosyltransferase family 4 protein [Luteimonas viscosa]|uniref:Glycosyltransferase family 4 protein n=1 Tax=Luteimonas viscosa TaxID=1132694 RepID=A0A5D4XJH2_9GAMM|nr:glycosyltransferase [Luteimonas viscosa]TYT23082.1 glycosyltransferase family 4 protein [Luteimonas viscosa]